MTLEFVDPPNREPRGNWAAFVAELRQHPDRWVIWKRNTFHQNARMLRLKFPNVTTRIVSSGKSDKGQRVYDIYVMWKENPDA